MVKNCLPCETSQNALKSAAICICLVAYSSLCLEPNGYNRHEFESPIFMFQTFFSINLTSTPVLCVLGVSVNNLNYTKTLQS